MAVYNFRFDREQTSYILAQLKEGLLCQGWGGGETNLSLVDHEGYGFVQETQKLYRLRTTRIPTNLTHIRDLKNGDILVTPHLPEKGTVSIHVVHGDYPDCYSYLPHDDTHLGHRIRIKKSYGLDGKISIYNESLVTWYAKLTGLRLPLLPINDLGECFLTVVRDLESGEGKGLKPSGLMDRFKRIYESLLGKAKEELYKLPSRHAEMSFEKACEFLLKSEGYEIESRNHYDKEGGDLDLRCSRERSDRSPFEAGQVILLVQVKKHQGTTDKHAVEQIKRMLDKEPGADACVISLADKFDHQAHTLAQQYGIRLINGREFCRLLLMKLASTDESSHEGEETI